MEASGKIFNDPVHGHIELSSLVVSIIDTPQFQRLRDISQLGAVYYVFPGTPCYIIVQSYMSIIFGDPVGASSMRFEHSIGVAYLARMFIDKIADSQPELNILPSEKLCVEIAGLCHDLGHGPFSHLFDGKVLPALGVSDFEHEDASVGILDILISENNLMHEFYENGLNENDINLIKDLILGKKTFSSVSRSRSFLFDIVANKRNGIDVDKFDYFARDCHVLGITKSFDALRLMKFARVFPVRLNKNRLLTHETSPRACDTPSSPSSYCSDNSVDSELDHEEDVNFEICFHIKEAWNIYELFHTRYALHKRAYQHRVCGSIDLMLSEAMIFAAPYLRFPGKDEDGRTVMRNLRECVDDFHAYWKLGDFIIPLIEFSGDQNLLPSQTIISRIRRRDLFALVEELLLSPQKEQILREEHGLLLKESVLLNTVHQVLESQSQEFQAMLNHEDVFLSLVKIGYGKGRKNPVTESTTFFQPWKHNSSSSSSNSNLSDLALPLDHRSDHWDDSATFVLNNGQMVKVGRVTQDYVSRLAPREYEETSIRLFCRHRNQVELGKKLFQQWRLIYGL